MNKTEEYLKIAIDAALEVGEYLRLNFGEHKVMFHKKGTHYGIDDDISADKLYKKILKKSFPEIDFTSEETEHENSSDFYWMVDAIEGTSNYRVGHPLFATQIALIKDEELLVSVVHAPMLNLTYHAIKDGGAYLNNKKITVTSIVDVNKALVSVNKGTEIKYLKWYARTTGKLAEKVRTFRNFGSTGLELANVADGKIDIHLNYGSKKYDYLPGSLIVREAGGRILSYEGKDWTTDDDFLIATNDILARKVLDIISD